MKVLLVEDNDDLRSMYRTAFLAHNVAVAEAADGETGVSETLLARPDAIVLDLMLPRQGGLRTLKVLRSLPETKHTPIVILTALPNPEYRAQAQPLVQGYYLKTQIKPAELVEKVKRLVD